MSEPFSIVIITGSPAQTSRTAALATRLSERLAREGFRVRVLHVRELPADALLRVKLDAPEIAAAIKLVEQADAVVVASPVYKAAYTGLLKSFLDLLPHGVLNGKVVLPLMTGGSLAHVLALEYALRPVLQALEPRYVVPGLFLLDQWLTISSEGVAEPDAECAPRLEAVVRNFVDTVRLAAEA